MSGDVFTCRLTCHDRRSGGTLGLREARQCRARGPDEPSRRLTEEGAWYEGRGGWAGPIPRRATLVASAFMRSSASPRSGVAAATRRRGRSHPSLGGRRAGDVQRRCRPRVGHTRAGRPRWRRPPQARLHDPAGCGRRRLREIVSRADSTREHVDLVRDGAQGPGLRAASTDRGGHRDQGDRGRPANPPGDSSPNGPDRGDVDWPAIGALREVVLSVSHTGDGGPAAGTILIDGRFEQLSSVRKLGMLPSAQARGRDPGQPAPRVAGRLPAGNDAAVAGDGPSDRGEGLRSHVPRTALVVPRAR